jgi:hypothetical protein
MAQSTDKFLLKEGVLESGVWTTPQLIGTDAIRPDAKFTGTPLAYFRQGSLTIPVQRTYAEFMSGTPGVKIRKDLITKAFSLTVEIGQFDPDLFPILKGTNSQIGYAVSTPSTQTWDLHHLGSDEPVQVAYGWLLRTFLTDGREFQVAIYSGRVTTEDAGITLSGTEHAVQNLTIEAFPHSGFTASDAAQKHYGAIFQRAA